MVSCTLFSLDGLGEMRQYGNGRGEGRQGAEDNTQE